MRQLLITCMTLILMAGIASAQTGSSGTVTAINGDDITVTMNTGSAPAVGAQVEVSFNLGDEKFMVGVWQVTHVDGNLIQASPVDVALPPETGMKALILPGAVPSAETITRVKPASGKSTWVNPDAAPTRILPLEPPPAGRSSDSGEAHTAAIQTMETNRYVRIWWDKGSGARVDFASFRPQAFEDYYPLGDVGVAGPWRGRRYAPPEFYSLLVKDGRLALRRPIGYRFIWSSRGSNSNLPFSSWEPVPPPGYRCLGNVGSASMDQEPSLDEIRCLPQECVISTPLREKIWDDTDSGADMDFSAWRVPQVNVYVGNRDHSKPFQNVDTINPSCLK